jgi:hypothetical protein
MTIADIILKTIKFVFKISDFIMDYIVDVLFFVALILGAIWLYDKYFRRKKE